MHYKATVICGNELISILVWFAIERAGELCST